MQGNAVEPDTNNGGGTAQPPKNLTSQDLVLGARASRYVDVLCLAGLGIASVLAVLVFISVPLDTRLPYSGRFARNGIPMPISAPTNSLERICGRQTKQVRGVALITLLIRSGVDNRRYG